MATATARAVQTLHFDQPPLPFAEDALAPIISAETIQFHYGKHHKKYYDTMNQLLQKEPVANARTLEDVVRNSSGKLFNNSAQAWNHNFYWQSLSPKQAEPSAALRKALERDFGSYDAFCDKLAAAENFSRNSSNEPKAASIAFCRWPVGLPPPLGDMLCQKKV